MSDPMNPAAPPARRRPGVVTISSILLFLVAALQVLGLITTFLVQGTINDVYEKAYADTDLAGLSDSLSIFTTAGAIIGAVVGLAIALVVVLLAVFNNMGKNASRIATWVVGGIFTCCSSFGLLGRVAGSSLSVETESSTEPDPAEIQRMVDEALPGWYQPVTVATSLITLIALLVALILLALPAANEFFRKPQVPGWEPPLPGGTYPGYPQSDPQYPQSGPPGPSYPQYPQGGQPGQPGPSYPQYPQSGQPGQSYPSYPSYPQYPQGGQPGQPGPSYPQYPQSGPPGPGNPPTPPAS